MQVKPQYVVDEHGQRTSVLLSLDEFNELMQLAEDASDSREMDEAIRDAERRGERPIVWEDAKRQLQLD